jgi:hypothetical protein
MRALKKRTKMKRKRQKEVGIKIALQRIKTLILHQWKKRRMRKVKGVNIF